MATNYLTPEGAAAYVRSRADAETSILINYLERLLPIGSSLLELGIGPGTDLLALSRKYEVTGSDNSPAFLDYFSKYNPALRVLNLDAETMETECTFDCIFSNKVLHHLSANGLRKSLARQVGLLNPGGLLCHSFWLGNESKCGDGLHFRKYSEDELCDLFSRFGKIRLNSTYREMNAGDSLAIAVSIPG